MPTSHTALLDEDPKLTTRKWIMESLARAFGVCVTLRESNSELTEEEILQELTKDVKNSWHEDRLKKAKQEAKNIAKRTDKEWRDLWEVNEAYRIKANEESIVRAKKKNFRYSHVEKDLEKIINTPEISDITRNIVKYGIKQLSIVHSECLPYIIKPLSFEDFVEKRKQKNIDDIEYHTKHLKEEKERKAERVKLYKQLQKDVTKILGK